MAFHRLLPPYSQKHARLVFLLCAVGTSLVLVALGWRSQQNKEIARKQTDMRREEAADMAVAALLQPIRATEEKLRDQEALRFLATTPDSISVTFGNGQVDAFPHGRLLYYPVASPGESAPDGAFEHGEALEHQRQDPRQAADWFQQLTRNASAPVRAGALIRAARNLSKAGQSDAALAAYSDAARLATTAIGEVPTELFARAAACDLLDRLGRTAELQRAALELRELLLEGRWRITRSVFELHLQAASRWARAGEPPASHRIALSEAVGTLWSSMRHAAPGTPVARSTITAGGMQFTVLSQTSGNRMNAFIAGPAFVEHEWKPRIASLEKRHGVHVSLHDITEPGGASRTSRRVAGETGLPWTITVRTSSAVPEGMPK